MTQDFSESMSNLTDEELIKIVTIDRNDYQTEAVAAAEKELKTRNIDATKIESVKLDIEEKETKDKEFESSIVSSWTRLIHTVIDFFGFIIIAVILSHILQLFYNPSDKLTIRLLGYALLLVSFFLYFVFMEYKFQKTIGKFLTKTKVVMADGRRPELNEIVIRTACRLIPFDYISYIFTKNGFHDKFSNSTVIRD
ncbi:MAG: RDD family protein [Paludibacter sp.]|nr:RDD family protein [Paludibacter sp.]